MSALRVFVAGHNGMVGSAIVRELIKGGRVEVVVRDRAELDLTDQVAVGEFLSSEKLDQVYLAAAKVGGILANSSYPADFLYENLAIEANVINGAFSAGIQRVMMIGSSCIYPRDTAQPITEDQLLTGPLEATNEPYALAKIVGIKLCESYNRQYGESHGIDYRAIMPTNLYGINDRYDQSNSHVIPGLIKRLHEAVVSRASSVEVWGTGKPLREFLNVDDCASAALHVMNLSRSNFNEMTGGSNIFVNVGSGEEVTIAELAEAIAEVVGYHGRLEYNPSLPDGTPRKLLNCSKLLTSGWSPSIPLKQGLKLAYTDFLRLIS